MKISYLLLLPLLTLCPHPSRATGVKVGIIQWGETHGMFSSMLADDLPNKCMAGQKCSGGIPLLLGYIEDLKKNYLGDISLQRQLSMVSGNLVSGENGYLNLLGWETYGWFLESLPPCCNGASRRKRKVYGSTELYTPDYMSLGVKDFEAGLDNTNRYLGGDFRYGVKPENIITNWKGSLDGPCEKIFDRHIRRHSIYKLNDDISIGIVGFVNPLVNIAGDAGEIVFVDPAFAIEEELNHPDLADVNFVVAVGTGNLKMAQSIIERAGRASKLKLVLYGQEVENVTGNYPMAYENAYIATTGSMYGTRVGAIKLTLDRLTGDFLNVEGTLRDVVEGAGIVANRFAMETFEKYMVQSGGLSDVAPTRVKVDGSDCWSEECNLGNLVTDAMVHCALDNTEKNYLNYGLREPIISLWYGGALFRSHLEPYEMVKVVDVSKWLSNPNKAFLVKVLGSTLRKLFETSAEALQENVEDKWSQFLQVSRGIQLTFSNGTLWDVRVARLENGVPKLMELDDDAAYNVVIPSMIFKRKLAWNYLTKEMFLNIPEARSGNFIELGTDYDCLKKYLFVMKTVSAGLEDRILKSSLQCNNSTEMIDETIPPETTDKSAASSSSSAQQRNQRLVHLTLILIVSLATKIVVYSY